MNPLDERVRHFLALFHQGRRDDAFHWFLELAPAGLPALEAAFCASRDPALRAFLLHVIWQHRQPSAIPLLGEALMDPEPRVWREALDGLVTLASPAAIAALRAAKARRNEADFQPWVDEALAQADLDSSQTTHDQGTPLS